MSPVDLNHRKVPKQLIDLYFEQVSKDYLALSSLGSLSH